METNAVPTADGKRFVSWDFKDGTIKLWDVVKGGDALLTLRGHDRVYINTIAVSADGKRIVSEGEDRLISTMKVWDAEKGGDALLTLRGHHRGINGIALSPDGRWIYSGGYDGTIKIWSAQKTDKVERIRAKQPK